MIILTSGRSGSQRLITSLKNRKDIRVFGEIFNLHSAGSDQSLFDFDVTKNKVIDKDLHDRMCTAEHLDKAIEKYDVFKVLYSHIKGDLYNALDGKHMIMLSRRNKFRCLVSVSLALRTGQWTGHNDKTISFSMDFSETSGKIEKMLKQERFMFERYKPTVIYYEDNFEESYNTVCREMGIEIQNPIITTVPTGVAAEDVIENFDELKELDREFYLTEKNI